MQENRYKERGERFETQFLPWIDMELRAKSVGLTCCIPETNTILLINYTPTWNKNLKNEGVYSLS